MFILIKIVCDKVVSSDILREMMYEFYVVELREIKYNMN